MTTSIVIDTNAALAASNPGPGANSETGRARPSGSRVNARQSFGGVVRSERIKFSSLRSIKVTLALTIVMGLGLSALIAFMWNGEMLSATPAAAELRDYLLITATFAAPFLALIFGVLGVFAISSEYTSGMILSTLAAVPRRGSVFAAKGLVLAILATIIGVVLVLGGLGLALALHPSAITELATLPVVTGTLGTVAYLLLIALFAYGVAGILRSTAGGIAVVAGVTFVLPIALQMMSMTGWEWVATVSNFIPINLGALLSQGITEADGAYGPSYLQSLLAMVIWAAVAVIPAAILFQKRDAK